MSQPPPTRAEPPAGPTSAGRTSADVVALAEDLGAIRRRVLNVIGHELRTPATTIQGLAEEVCTATDLDQVTSELGPALLRNAVRLMDLLDQMLVAAGVQTAIPAGDPEDVEVADLLRARWAVRGTATPIDVHGPPAVVRVPRNALVTAVDAVLDNAVQYGMAAPEVVVTALDDVVTVAVATPGPPPHPEEVRLAAEPFYRGERAVTTRPGLGLGLAIARAVMDHLGGDLRISADDDQLVTSLLLPLVGQSPGVR